MTADRPTLFIADLHLDECRPEVTDLFLRFLQQQASTARSLYILGYLFEAWIGDDWISAAAHRVIDAMRRLVEGGVPIHLLHGNRDFLLGEQFACLSGCRLLSDPVCMDLYGTPTLLTHGDQLCTEDTAYQALRRQLRDPAFIKNFLGKPPEERFAYAEQLRKQSREAVSGKEESIMDVNTEAVQHLLRQYGATRLIHGHTHRPGLHPLVVDGTPAERLVLGDWGPQGSMLVCTENKRCQLETVE